jgi:hypothetical protein
MPAMRELTEVAYQVAFKDPKNTAASVVLEGHCITCLRPMDVVLWMSVEWGYCPHCNQFWRVTKGLHGSPVVHNHNPPPGSVQIVRLPG